MDQKTSKSKMFQNPKLKAEKFWLNSKPEASAELTCTFIGVTGKSSGDALLGTTRGESAKTRVKGS